MSCYTSTTTTHASSAALACMAPDGDQEPLEAEAAAGKEVEEEAGEEEVEEKEAGEEEVGGEGGWGRGSWRR